MPSFTLDIAETVALGTQVAVAGAIRIGEMASDELFEHIISVAVLIYEMNPA